jgi:colicin import membrane protein
MDDKALIVVEKLNPALIFTETDALDRILDDIKQKAMAHVPVLDTVSGRKDIASVARKVASSKVILDDLGKDLVSDWKEKSKKVDSARKTARDFLDSLKDEVRKPLTDWEEAESKREAAEKLLLEIELCHEDALKENDTFNKLKELEKIKADLARKEAAEKAREEAARIEKERIEREARIAKEAAERATREAEEKSESLRRESERKLAEAKEAAEKAERDRVAFEARAKAEKEAAILAEQEKARIEAERVEAARIEAEESAKKESARKAADREHRAKINNEALAGFIANGVSEESAKSIICLIAKNIIPNVFIKY